MTELKSVTVRMRNDVYEKLKKIAHDKGISQGRTIEDLINDYRENGEGASNLKDSSGYIQQRLLLRYENYFLKKEEQVREPKNYTFKGKCIWPWNAMQHHFVDIKHAEEKLKEEFKIEESLKEYTASYWFGVLYNVDSEKYVVTEAFNINEPGVTRFKLHVARCKFAKNLKEIKQHIEPYAVKEDILEIERILAEEIVDDADVELFSR